MGKIRTEIIYFVLALVVIFISVPLLPSSLLLKPESISVEEENISFTRSVLFPVNAHWSLEFERMTPIPPIRRVDCDQSGDAHFEVRYGRPVIFAHNCTFDGQADSEWELRMCWEVSVVMLNMRPVCKVKTFYPLASELSKQLSIMRQEINELRSTRN